MRSAKALKHNKQRVAITGIGVILPNAERVEDFWIHLREGQSQIRFLRSIHHADLPVKVGAELGAFDYRQFLPDLDEKFAA